MSSRKRGLPPSSAVDRCLDCSVVTGAVMLISGVGIRCLACLPALAYSTLISVLPPPGLAVLTVLGVRTSDVVGPERCEDGALVVEPDPG